MVNEKRGKYYADDSRDRTHRIWPSLPYSKFKREYLFNRDSGTDDVSSIFSFIAILCVVLLIITLSWVHVSGVMRGVLIILTMGIAASLLARKMDMECVSPMIWKRESKLDSVIGSRIQDISALSRRAYEGQEASQALFEERIKTILIERVSEERNMSVQEVRDLIKDPERLRIILNDDVLADFVVHGREFRDTGDKEAHRKTKEDGERYKQKIRTIIKHIEEWK